MLGAALGFVFVGAGFVVMDGSADPSGDAPRELAAARWAFINRGSPPVVDVDVRLERRSLELF